MIKTLLLVTAIVVAAVPRCLAQGEIPIGMIGPMTGYYALFGAEMRTGAEQAVADINAAGGINGRSLRLLIEDDACDPGQALTAAGKLAAAKVKFVAGHFCSQASIRSSKVYAEEGIPMISPGSTDPRLTDERVGTNIFRVCGREDQQGDVAGKYIADTFKGQKVAILHDRTGYGRGLAEKTKKAMNSAGLMEVMFEGYPAGEKDYSALVTRMKGADIDVVYVGGYHTEVSLIVRGMRGQGMGSVVMSGDALVNGEYWQLAGAAGEGTLMTFLPDAERSPAATDVRARFAAKKISTQGAVLYTYAAIQAWAQAAQAAKTEDGRAVIAKLNEIEIKSVLGTFKFDKKGDPSLPPYKLYQWKAGRYDQVN